jgi:MoxR-like ATPase
MTYQEQGRKLRQLHAEIGKVVIGYERPIERIITVLLARGHVLLRAVPGTGKTTLVSALQKAIDDSQSSRIQLTPDTKPSDLIGGRIWDPGTRGFVTAWGPVVENNQRPVNLLLADEINRTPGKTLAALLQPAQEGSVTIGDDTRAMDELYMILATMNPVEQEGTYELPEAMIDRFAVLLDLGYLQKQEELEMLGNILRNKRRSIEQVLPVISKAELLEMQKTVEEIAAQTPQAVMEYIVDLVRATRPDDARFGLVHKDPDGKLGRLIAYGASPRAALWCAYIGAAQALYDGKGTTTIDHIKSVAADVLNHRVIPQPSARKFDVREQLIHPALKNVPVIDGNLAKTNQG